MPVSTATPVLSINARAVRRLRQGAVWVYRSDLATGPNGVTPRAAIVHLTDDRGRFLGTAFSSSSSQIALRIISLEQLSESDLPRLIADRIAKAVAYRQQVVRDSDAYRVVFSEADHLPGLIIDRYADVLVVQ